MISTCTSKRRIVNRTAVMLIVSLLLGGCAGKAKPEQNSLEAAIDRAAGYLARKVDENGKFEYRLNLDEDVRVKESYNILRHAGTIYALASYHALKADPVVLTATERAASYLRREAVRPVPDKPEMLAVIEPAVISQGAFKEAKLGGAGLGLVALISIENLRPGFTPLAELQALGRFITFMQKEDGSFHSKYIPAIGGPSDDWESLYYPGEAALGLLMLYEKDGSKQWLHSATRALTYLSNVRRDKPYVPIDHWALIATDKLLSINADLPVSRELLIGHAVQICQAIVREQIRESARPDLVGGFLTDGRTTPAATRLEGLIAALRFLPPEQEITKQVAAAVPPGIGFLVRAQITEGEFEGAFPRAVEKIDNTVKGADRFNRRANEVRIDYVQHALSAMIEYLRMLRHQKVSGGS